MLYRHYRGGQGVAADYFFIPGISFGGRWWGKLGPNVFRSGARSGSSARLARCRWAAGHQLEVIKANAAYAIALAVAKGQIVPGNDKNKAYAGFYAGTLSRWLRTRPASSQQKLDTRTRTESQTP